ncbi:MAG: S-layer homology domain-containing protein [Oscillospiraceae bacterium]|nr:S-layer homology domain-containing protein [Oscillospiraceae bacterium]
MRRAICFLLTLVLLAGMASAAFTDESKITADFTAAVAYMSEKGVIGGFPDGSFKPKDTLTRAQAAKIICTVLEGADKVDAISATANFSDVSADHWAAKFVGYCADKGIVSGVGNNKFNPNGQLTGAAFAKMLLVAYGADGSKFTGENWVISVQKALREAKMNYKVGATEEPMQREQACQMAYNFMRTEELKNVTGYQEVTVKPTAQNVKLLGRAEATANGVLLNFPADGIEFTTDCVGEIKVQYASDAAHYVTAFVDGKETDQRAGVQQTSVGTASVYRFIEPGAHTIRIVQDSEVNTSGKRITIQGVVLQAKSGEVKPTAQKKHYIEFVGASTVAGCGTLGDTKTAWSAAVHAGTKSFAYFTAENLDVDYSIVAKGGIGFIKKSGGVTYTPMYMLQNAWADSSREAPFSRIPDIVVYARGGNDKATEEEYYAAMKEFLIEARKKTGPDTLFVVTHNASTKEKTFRAYAEERLLADLGGEAKGYYAVELPGDFNGVIATGASTPHPNAADNVKAAAVLTDYLKTLLK